ncbi:unnamed protein product [Pedinophyceae sp. YPF-701]|nr:unnamed protein product [Pedinophyceae sp. YPF-701]
MSRAAQAEELARTLARAARRNALVPREGLLLRPPSAPMSQSDLAAGIEKSRDEAQGLSGLVEGLAGHESEGKVHTRAKLYVLRACACRAAGRPVQALEDIRRAVVYARESSCRLCRAHAGYVLGILEADRGAHAVAVLALQSACDARPEEPAAGVRAARKLAEVVGRLDGPQRAAFDAGGAEGLRRRLDVEAHERLPPFLRPSPEKYPYYTEWTRQRIAQACGAELPEPVVRRLLAMNADDLELQMQHPSELCATAGELVEVLAARGEAALMETEPRRLSWQDVQRLKGPVVGLGIAAPADVAPQRDPPAPAAGRIRAVAHQEEMAMLELNSLD